MVVMVVVREDYLQVMNAGCGCALMQSAHTSLTHVLSHDPMQRCGNCEPDQRHH